MSKEENTSNYINRFWLIILAPVFLLLLIVTLTAFEIFGDLPSIEELQNPKSNLATVVYSSDMKEIGKFYLENRTNVRYKEINSNVIHALLATEDIRFYKHSGIDGRGLVRVLFKTVLGGDQSSGGGSTITQQLAKMLFPRNEKQSKFELAFRKIKEWIIAVKLEKQYTKEEIMTMYLNKFDFLNLAVGIKSASTIYFDKSPDSLKVEEAAMLVGMAQNPSLYNPVRRLEQTQKRRNIVLGQMMKYNFITQQQFDSLKQIPITLNFKPESHNEGLATYFREYLRDNFLKKWTEQNPKPDGTKYDVYRDGLKIYTTIDSRMQTHAEEAVNEHMSDLQVKFFKDCKKKKNSPFAWNVTKKEIEEIMNSAMKRSSRFKNLKKAGMSEDSIKLNFMQKTEMRIFSWKGDIDTTLTPWDSIKYYKSILQTGFMAMEPQTGFVKAWVGGINHEHFQYDHVKIGKRQVGSTFKPFVYALAIQEGYSPCYRVPNVPVTIDYDKNQPAWTPKNAAGEEKYEGKMVTLKFALAQSINYISAYLIKQFGPQALVNFVRKLGITSPMEAVPSICLGTPEISVYEMVGANSTFANKGTWIEPIFVTRIEDKNGKVLAEFFPKSEEVMSEEKAYIMTQLMQGVVLGGTGGRLRFTYKLNNPIAGKTGTTQNNSDGWFMGLTPDLASGCWVGAEDRSVHFNSTDQGQGAAMALPIYAKFLQKVYADNNLKTSKGEFEKPKKKIEVELDCSQYDKDMDKGTTEDFDNSQENF